MHFTKPMIELVFEIRRNAPQDLKSTMKLTNPSLFKELGDYFHAGANTVSKALIKELLGSAGQPWSNLLYGSDEQALDPQKLGHQRKSGSVRIYRGQVVA